MWIGKVSFCLLLWQSITLMSSALHRTQPVRLCLFCDHSHRGNTPQAKHIFPDFFHFPWLFPDHCQIPWFFQVGGRPVNKLDHKQNTCRIQPADTFLTSTQKSKTAHLLWNQAEKVRLTTQCQRCGCEHVLHGETAAMSVSAVGALGHQSRSFWYLLAYTLLENA